MTVFDEIIADLFAPSDAQIEPPPPAFGELVRCDDCGRQYVDEERE